MSVSTLSLSKDTRVLGPAEPVIPGQSPIASGEEYALGLPLAGSGGKSFICRAFVPADGDVSTPPRDHEVVEFPLSDGRTVKGFVAKSDLDHYNVEFQKSAKEAAGKLAPHSGPSGVLGLFAQKSVKASGSAPTASTKSHAAAEEKINKKIASLVPAGSGVRVDYRLNEDGTIGNVKVLRDGKEDAALAAKIASSLKTLEPEMPRDAGFRGKVSVFKPQVAA